MTRPARPDVDLAARVSTVREAVAGSRTRPGRTRPAPFEGAQTLPTMLAADEVALLYRLARDVVDGWGAVVELGTFLGGSTVALGRGLQDGAVRRRAVQAWADDAPRLHTYDLFVQEAWPDFGVAEGERVLPRWEATVAGVRDLVDVHPGPLRAADAPAGPVELLFVDVVKQAPTITEVMHGFVARCVPGSVVVHQDLFHWGSPWVAVTVAALWDRLAYVGHAARSSGVLVVTDDVAELARAVDWGALAVSAQLCLVDELAARFTHPTLRGTLELAALYLAKTADPALYERRLRDARARSGGPRVDRFLAEVEAADAGLGALRPGHAA